jgi:CTP synthase
MRLGAEECRLTPGSKVAEVYGADVVSERHRHRWEFNNDYLERLQAAGLKIAGRSTDHSLVEVVEVDDHPWFVGCQFHPEFTSTPRDGHPLFTSFVEAAVTYSKAGEKESLFS